MSGEEPWGKLVRRAAGDRSLVGQDLRVLISIASRAFGVGVADNASLVQIGADCRIEPCKVSGSVNALEAAGYLRVRRWRRGNVYHLVVLDKVLPPEEVPRAAVPREEVPPEALPPVDKWVAVGGNHTDLRTERNTLTRAREGACLPSLDDYQPSQNTIEFARELGLDALSKDMLDHWRDDRRAKGKILADLDADYRNWLRNEKRINPGGSQPRYAKLRGQEDRNKAGSMIKTAINYGETDVNV
jgi:hypothetical protein